MVAAIIVTYDPKLDLLSKQFNILKTEVDYLIYIDNNSKNIYDIENLLKDYSKIILVKNSSNLGLGAAQNLGICKALELDIEYIVLFDQDSTIEKCFILSLLNPLEELLSKNIKVAAVGPVYYNKQTNEQYPITKYWGPFIKRLYPTDKPIQASVLISSGTLIPLKLIKDIGLIDERLFIDYLDIEWSYRAQSKGYKLFVIPTARMNHQIGDARTSLFGRRISVHSPLRRYYLSRNSIHMLRCSYVSWGYKLRELSLNILRIFIFSLMSNKKIEYIKYSFIGIYDGITGLFGECQIKK